MAPPKGHPKKPRMPETRRKNDNWKTAWMKRDTGKLVCTIAAESLEPDDAPVSSESGFEDLCSYNWQNDGAILVPDGHLQPCHSLWPQTLAPDAGPQFVDQNTFRVPKHPFEPAFQALSAMNPNVRLDDVDIVANRNSLRKLLDFAAGRGQEPFCMGLHMVKDTLFISRKERNAQSMIHGAPNSGYGHSFEKAVTTAEDGLGDSSSHHRVIRYRLGHLDCVVRFEVDAYYEATDDAGAANSIQEPVDHITTKMGQLAVQKPHRSPTGKDTMQVIMAGLPVSSHKLAELKARKSEKLNATMPQLWFGRTPYLLTGKHIDGVVHSISTTHAKLQFAAWETVNQHTLRKLVRLLAELKRIVNKTEKGAAILLCENKGAPLRLLEAKKENHVLPEDMVVQYWSPGEGGGVN
ncbi:hypothetical protein BU16DRAFT_552210 [Lophium mytilinum]|uniref:Geranylgeranyl pyrophosphate synthetase n=1 Tax=Lophium mytilinum TaxID=390894 RepID=A0A6A6QHD1_9PEZI|nr:hypothetical protein BU16DRAFT_552210 [Lophium mytilinum]